MDFAVVNHKVHLLEQTFVLPTKDSLRRQHTARAPFLLVNRMSLQEHMQQLVIGPPFIMRSKEVQKLRLRCGAAHHNDDVLAPEVVEVVPKTLPQLDDSRG